MATISSSLRNLTFGSTTDSNLSQQTLVYSHKSSMQGKTFSVYYSPDKGLFGSVQTLEKRQDNLPLTGIPKQLLTSGNLDLFKRFFSQTHFIYSEDMGEFPHIAVHLSCKGGMKPKIPFQPGLALGSIVKAKVVREMEVYAKNASDIDNFEKDIQTVESNIRALEQKIAAIHGKYPRKEREEEFEAQITLGDRALRDFYRRQSQRLREQLATIGDNLAQTEPVMLHTPGDFQSSLASPIDYERSYIATEPRSFDSVNYSSQYIDMQENIQHVRDQLDQSSSSSSMSLSVSAPFFKASGSFSSSQSAMDRVAQIQNSGTSSKVFVMNATLTTHHVRYFKRLRYDHEKLGQIFNIMHNYTISTATGEAKVQQAKNLEDLGINIDPLNNEELSIYILTEAVMGGSFTGIVNFMDKSRFERDVQNSRRDSSLGGSASAEGSYGFYSGGASVSHSQSKSHEERNDSLSSQSNLDVSINLIAQGAVPKLQRDAIARENTKHADQNLTNYQSSGSESVIERDAGAQQKATYDRQKQLQAGGLAAANTTLSTVTKQESITILTPNSVMQAYDDYCDLMVDNDLSGVPVGFAYTKLTYVEIGKMLAANRIDAAARRARTVETPARDESSEQIGPTQDGNSEEFDEE